jgi:GT2 family glycosyltransferase
MENVTLGVVSYRSPDLVDRALASSSGLSHRIVVNVEADPAVARVARNHGVEVIDLSENVGFAAAVNVLAGATRTEWLAFANADVTLAEGLLQAVAWASANQWDVVCPAHLDEHGRRIASLRALPSPGRFLCEWILLPDQRKDWPLADFVQKWRLPTLPEPATAATAAAVLVRTDVLRQTPMPEYYFLYWEEMDWFWQLHDRGIVVTYDPRWTVRRSGGRSELGTRKWYLMGRNAVLLGQRRYGRAGAFTYRGIVVLWLARLMAGDVLAPDRRQRWRARRAAFHGAFGFGPT